MKLWAFLYMYISKIVGNAFPFWKKVGAASPVSPPTAPVFIPSRLRTIDSVIVSVAEVSRPQRGRLKIPCEQILHVGDAINLRRPLVRAALYLLATSSIYAPTSTGPGPSRETNFGPKLTVVDVGIWITTTKTRLDEFRRRLIGSGAETRLASYLFPRRPTRRGWPGRRPV